jgi:hypothetical protein
MHDSTTPDIALVENVRFLLTPGGDGLAQPQARAREHGMEGVEFLAQGRDGTGAMG